MSLKMGSPALFAILGLWTTLSLPGVSPSAPSRPEIPPSLPPWVSSIGWGGSVPKAGPGSPSSPSLPGCFVLSCLKTCPSSPGGAAAVRARRGFADALEKPRHSRECSGLQWHGIQTARRGQSLHPPAQEGPGAAGEAPGADSPSPGSALPKPERSSFE